MTLFALFTALCLSTLSGAIASVLHELRDYAALFTPAEKAVAAQFALLPPTARALYARLQLRRGPWFRVDSMLHYDECSEDTPAWLVLRRQRSLQLEETADAATTTAGDAISEIASITQVRCCCV
jgi:hypothetical protein